MVLLEVSRYSLRSWSPWVKVCFPSPISPALFLTSTEMTIVFDSGIQTGADVFKAIALGAQSVMVGRLYVWGMAHDGEAGCRHVMKSLLAVSCPFVYRYTGGLM